MYTAKIQNAQGEILQLNDQENKWAVLSITGLNPAPAQLSMSEIYGMDGSRMNYAKLTARNIVIMLRLCGDVEQNRLEIYHYFPQKAPVRFFYKTRTRDVYIDGYVETIEGDLYTQNEVFQISLICPDPFFRSADEFVVELQNSRGEFTFPFAIDQNDPVEFGSYSGARTTEVINDTQTETPIEITITAREQLSVFTWFVVQNQLTGEKIGFSGWPIAHDEGFMPGDVIYINTDPAHPTMQLLIGNTVYNKIPNMIPGGSFFQLHPGENVFAYKTYPTGYDMDNKVDVTMTFRKLYRGV